ncbi:hypothetical protein SCOCK_30153 [Actinacidiphila cocklensis]|uniref:Uncharacterized protein n=1 Tax=Actinacidiphila cocklensis TaxID=887465 RepID=A0A9W4DRI0_9ACTN|nr:hypothetical protein SCOCK_30153 [Actinacidiphila cocklensis]
MPRPCWTCPPLRSTSWGQTGKRNRKFLLSDFREVRLIPAAAPSVVVVDGDGHVSADETRDDQRLDPLPLPAREPAADPRHVNRRLQLRGPCGDGPESGVDRLVPHGDALAAGAHPVLPDHVGDPQQPVHLHDLDGPQPEVVLRPLPVPPPVRGLRFAPPPGDRQHEPLPPAPQVIADMRDDLRPLPQRRRRIPAYVRDPGPHPHPHAFHASPHHRHPPARGSRQVDVAAARGLDQPEQRARPP